ncbi:MAG: hypothetical protein KDA66_07205 [Planctomycetaceae bacterium]|nr:hypothetical protein [Planctomycetaceae bacterium]
MPKSSASTIFPFGREFRICVFLQQRATVGCVIVPTHVRAFTLHTPGWYA